MTKLAQYDASITEKVSALKKTPSSKSALSGLKQKEKIDKLLLVVLDRSGSMSDRMEMSSKIELAWRVLRNELMPTMAGWQYGIIVFSDYHEWSVMPQASTTAMATIAPRPVGGTSMGETLKYSWAWLRSMAKAARIILITDGEPTDHAKDSIVSMAKEEGIPIDTVGIGQGCYSYDPVFLRNLSTATGGAFHEASSAKLLADMILKLSPQERPLLGTVKKEQQNARA